MYSRFSFGDHYWDFRLGNFTENIRETIEKILSFHIIELIEIFQKEYERYLLFILTETERMASLQEEYRETVKFIPFDTILLRLENSQLHGPHRRELMWKLIKQKGTWEEKQLPY